MGMDAVHCRGLKKHADISWAFGGALDVRLLGNTVLGVGHAHGCGQLLTDEEESITDVVVEGGLDCSTTREKVIPKSIKEFRGLGFSAAGAGDSNASGW